MVPLPTGLACSAALPCPGGIWTSPIGCLCSSLGLGKWTGQAPALVLASAGPLLHAFNHKLFYISFVPGIRPGVWASLDWAQAQSLSAQICSLEEETDINGTLA